VSLFRRMKSIRMTVVAFICITALCFPFALDESSARAAEPATASLLELGKDLLKNVEEMVAHGGMGDGKAILHHCGEATRIAEAIIVLIPPSDPHQADATASLKEVIRHCNRVSAIGVHADPGQLLNPATKARAAAQESMKLLGLTKTNRG
jgi:hypothetical protein